jgi:hypothetical protein
MIAQLGILKRRIAGGGTNPPVVGGTLELGTPGNLLYQLPIVYGENYGTAAMIFTAAELGAAKTITGIEVYFRSFPLPISYPSQLIKMGNVTSSQFDATPDMSFSEVGLSGLITVKNAFTQLINTNNAWYNITFDTPFVYDGTKNLLIVWENNWGSWTSAIGGTSSMTATNSVAKKGSATFPVTGNGTVSSNRPVIKIHY